MVKAKLRKLPCSSTVRFKLDELLDSLEFNEKRVVKTTQQIRRFCSKSGIVPLHEIPDDDLWDWLDCGQSTSGPHWGLARA